MPGGRNFSECIVSIWTIACLQSCSLLNSCAIGPPAYLPPKYAINTQTSKLPNRMALLCLIRRPNVCGLSSVERQSERLLLAPGQQRGI